MGVFLFPAVEGETTGWAEFRSAGKPLARVILQLEKIAKKNQLSPLYDFYDMLREQAIAELLGGDPDDPSTYDEAKIPAEKWFDPSEGLETVEFYIQYVEGHAVDFHNPDSVLKDLREFERILRAAKSAGKRWHLAQLI